MTSASLSKSSRSSNSKPSSAQPVLALYEQVKAYIAHKIQDGSWKAGQRVPSESELVARFGVARMTVNRALRELTEQGRIVRVAGVGSFVAEEKPQSTLLQIANIASEIRARGHDYRCEFLVAKRVAASPDVAVWLDLRPGESVFHTVCLHLENDIPVQLEDRHVNPRVVPHFLDQDFSIVPPSEYLRRNVPFDQIEHVVDAVLPSPEHYSASQPSPYVQRRREWILEQMQALGGPDMLNDIDAYPNSSNVIPVEVTVSLNVRHPADSVRLGAYRHLRQAAAQIAQRKKLALEWVDLLDQKTVHLDPFLMSTLAAASPNNTPRLVSGAGHDAMILAPHIPSAMLFLRSPGGVSHHPSENVLPEDVDVALEIGRRFIESMSVHYK